MYSKGLDQVVFPGFCVYTFPKVQFVYNVAERITKTYPYNFDPIKPHFYIVKLRFTGVYIRFLILLEKT